MGTKRELASKYADILLESGHFNRYEAIKKVADNIETLKFDDHTELTHADKKEVINEIGNVLRDKGSITKDQETLIEKSDNTAILALISLVDQQIQNNNNRK